VEEISVVPNGDLIGMAEEEVVIIEEAEDDAAVTEEINNSAEIAAMVLETEGEMEVMEEGEVMVELVGQVEEEVMEGAVYQASTSVVIKATAK